jgi:hypothetical protein
MPARQVTHNRPTERQRIDLGNNALRSRSVAWLTFNRPQARNAMTWAMYDGLYAACERVDADETVRAFVLRGAGDRAFVAGTDISQFQAFQTAEDALHYERSVNRYVSRLEAVRKPTIAMIRGYCVGGGAAIATACDLRIAGCDAKFGVPIARTLGNTLSAQNLARLVALIARPHQEPSSGTLGRRRGGRRSSVQRVVRRMRSCPHEESLDWSLSRPAHAASVKEGVRRLLHGRIDSRRTCT